MKAIMWVFLVAVSLSSVAAQNVNLTFSSVYPYETDSIYIYCSRSGYSWSQIASLTFWAVNSVATHYHELSRDCSTGNISQTNSTMGGRLTPVTQSLSLLWRNLSVADGNKNYSCSLRACSNAITEYSNAAALNVLQSVLPPVWLSPNETVVQVYANQLTRISFVCNAASLKAYESLAMCLNYVNSSGTQRSCHNSSVIGNNTVSVSVSTSFPKNAAASSFFNCYTLNRLNPVPSYASGRTLLVNYATDEIAFNVGTLNPDLAKLNKLSNVSYELRILQSAMYTFRFQCVATGIPEPSVSISEVTGLSSNEYITSGPTFSSPSVLMTTGKQFTVYCKANYYYSAVGSKVFTGSLLVRYAPSTAAIRSLSSVLLFAMLLALSVLKASH